MGEQKKKKPVEGRDAAKRATLDLANKPDDVQLNGGDLLPDVVVSTNYNESMRK